MPDPNAIAASKDIVQMLFYFVCVMGGAIAFTLIWFARYMLLPARDRHFLLMDHFKLFMDRTELSGAERMAMHRDNVKKLSEIYALQVKINDKIKCDSSPTQEGT